MKKIYVPLILSLVVVAILLSCSHRRYSPYVSGVVLKKEMILAHFDNQRPVIVEQASILGFLMPQKGSSRSYSSSSSSSRSSSSSSRSYSTPQKSRSYSTPSNTTSSSRSYIKTSPTQSSSRPANNYSGSSSRSYRTISTSRPSHVRPFSTPYTYSTRSSYYGNRSSLIYASSYGRYYTPIVTYGNYWDYQYCYNRSNGYLLLPYIMVYHNMNDEYETPIRYYLPEYKLYVQDSTNYKEWVSVDSATFNHFHRGDYVNFPRFKVAEYENEWQ